VARAVALEPDVLLLDEPTGVADRAAVSRLYQTLEEERVRGAAVCFASHQLEDAYRWSDTLIALADGHASPVTPENLFRTVLPEGDGPKSASVGPLEILVVTDKSGTATIAIPPDEILVSLEPLQSSARNEFRGRVTRVGDDGRGGVTLLVDAGVDLAVHITRGALEQLGLHIGTQVVLSFKAMAVRVF
jgi:molybdopterin-binding protein